MVSLGDWSVSIDLTDIFFHVPINLEHQHFLCFAVSPTEAYQFWALAFSFSSSLWILTMVLKEAVQDVHYRGINSTFTLMTG